MKREEKGGDGVKKRRGVEEEALNCTERKENMEIGKEKDQLSVLYVFG